MAMNLSPTSGSGDPEVLVEMNATPLIDVMLVLLIMLIITLPIQLHAVNINNPAGNSAPPATPPEVVRVDIASDDSVLWNGEKLADLQLLDAKLASAVGQAVQPELHVRPDKAASYRTLAAVMARVQRHGLKKVGIVGNEQFLN
jgi:biopolymer transport protein ExbD